MKIKVKGTIQNMMTDPKTTPNVTVEVFFKGNAVRPGASGKDVSGRMFLEVSQLVAGELRFGESLYVTIDTNESEPEIDIPKR